MIFPCALNTALNVGPFHLRRDCRPVCVWLTCPPFSLLLQFVSAGYCFRSLSLSVQERSFPPQTISSSRPVEGCLFKPFQLTPLIQFRNNITGLVVIWSFYQGLRVYRKSIINSFELIFLSKFTFRFKIVHLRYLIVHNKDHNEWNSGFVFHLKKRKKKNKGFLFVKNGLIVSCIRGQVRERNTVRVTGLSCWCTFRKRGSDIIFWAECNVCEREIVVQCNNV